MLVSASMDRTWKLWMPADGPEPEVGGVKQQQPMKPEVADMVVDSTSKPTSSAAASGTASTQVKSEPMDHANANGVAPME